MRVVILYNEYAGLIRGEANDATAAMAVMDEVEGVRAACVNNGWEAITLAAPQEPGGFVRAVHDAAPDAVFNLVEEMRGNPRYEAAAAWLLELSGVPYTGSPPQALSLANDKPLTQAALRGLGLAVPNNRVLVSGEESLEGLNYPCIVKPAREDASHGINADSVVQNAVDARLRAAYVISAYRQPALIEEFLPGREFNVSVLGEGQTAFMLHPAEIDYSHFPRERVPLVTYDGKWKEDSIDFTGTPSIKAVNVEADLLERIEALAISAFRALDLRDYGRVDMRLDAHGTPYIMEVNPNPDISPQAGLARAAGWSGICYDKLIAKIVQSAIARNNAARTA